MRIASRVIGGVLAVTLLSQLTACGSIFYPDRRGQIDGKIDPAIAVLDAVGLLFYVIPLQTIIQKETGRTLPLDDPRMIQFKGSVQQLASLGLQPAA
ncbi:hypothetical protein AO262_30110 [Pseudomonas fluorescens ABAC62]|nr:hypothetical protein AO262_30110 [Pseudomonas fluorescens ABAC62]